MHESNVAEGYADVSKDGAGLPPTALIHLLSPDAIVPCLLKYYTFTKYEHCNSHVITFGRVIATEQLQDKSACNKRLQPQEWYTPSTLADKMQTSILQSQSYRSSRDCLRRENAC